MNSLSITNTIERLTAHKDGHCIGGPIIIMLLAYALHCNDIREEIRHSKRFFRGLLTQTLPQKIFLTVNQPMDHLLFLEILANRAVFKTIRIIASELVGVTIVDENENKTIIHQVFFETTHIIVDGLIEEAINDKNQEDELITTTINHLLLNVWSHINRQYSFILTHDRCAQDNDAWRPG